MRKHEQTGTEGWEESLCSWEIKPYFRRQTLAEEKSTECTSSECGEA